MRVQVGFLGLLTILFVGLKLANVIHWSWLWVVSPLWIWFALAGLFWGTIFALGGLGVLIGITRR